MAFRRVGKSSLLNRVVRQLQESGRIVITITASGLQPTVQDQESIVTQHLPTYGQAKQRTLPRYQHS